MRPDNIRALAVIILFFIAHVSFAQHRVWNTGNPLKEDLYAWNPYGYINNTNSLDKTSKELTYLITFKDSTKLSTAGKIGEHKGQFFLYVDNETMTRSIRPSETLSIVYTPKKGQPLPGVAVDSCWLFRIVEGPVNLYTVTPQQADQFVIYIQDGPEGQMMMATRAKIRWMLKKDDMIGLSINNLQFIAAVKRHNMIVENERKKKR